MFIGAILKDEDGKTMGNIVANDKTFASGSRGYHGL